MVSDESPTHEEGAPEDEEFFREFRERMSADPLEEFEEEDETAPRRRRPLRVWLAVLAGALIVAFVAWDIVGRAFSTAPDGSGVPVIRREEKAVKVRPEEPGGMEVPDQDKLIYDRIAGGETEEPVERFLPPPEEPEMPPVVAEEKAEVADGSVEAILSAEARNAAPSEPETPGESDAPDTSEDDETRRPSPAARLQRRTVRDESENTRSSEEAVEKQEKKKAAPEPVETALPSGQAEPSPVDDSGAESPTPPQKTESEKEPSEPEQEKTKEAKPADSDGPWQIQLLAARKKPAARSAWERLVKKYEALEGLSPVVVRADLGEKGTFYRLRASGFETRAEAAKVCARLKEAGQGCLAVRP